MPTKIISDMDSPCNNVFWIKLCELLGIHLCLTWSSVVQPISRSILVMYGVCYSEAGRQWQGYRNRTNADNETGEVKNGCKSHQPQNWDRLGVCALLVLIVPRPQWFDLGSNLLPYKLGRWQVTSSLGLPSLFSTLFYLVLSSQWLCLRLVSVCPLREVLNLGVLPLF